MKLYISGPMSGKVDLNRAAFVAAEEVLRDAGYDVVNPAALAPPLATWEANMRRDIVALLQCDGIAWLEGWNESRGARIEVMLGLQLGMPCHGVGHWMKRRALAEKSTVLALSRTGRDGR